MTYIQTRTLLLICLRIEILSHQKVSLLAKWKKGKIFYEKVTNKLYDPQPSCSLLGTNTRERLRYLNKEVKKLTES